MTLLRGLLGLGLLASALWAVPPAVASVSNPYSDPVMQRASNLIEWGRLKEARDLLADAVNQADNAGNAALLAYYAHVLVKFGDLRAGLAAARHAIAIDSSCALCHLYLFEAMGEKAKGVNQMRALVELPKMKKQLEEATRLDPSLGDVQWGWIDLDLDLPATVGGSAKDALVHADKLSQIDPVDGHLARASIYEFVHKDDQAMAEYRAAAREHPEDPRGVFALGQALFERGDHAAAAPYLARALELNSESSLYSGYQAANLVHLTRLDQARDVILAAQKVHPQSRLGAYLVAQALHETGQDYVWAKQLLALYLDVPPEPDQPSHADARSLMAALG